jgi:hypothetical protein
MQENDNPAFAELPSLFAYQPLEKLKIVVAVIASISGTHKKAALRFAFTIRWPIKPTASKGGSAHEAL